MQSKSVTPTEKPLATQRIFVRPTNQKLECLFLYRAQREPHCSYYVGEQWAHISPYIKPYGLQISTVVSAVQWTYYVIFHSFVSILSTFSILSDSCNTNHKHLPTGLNSLAQFAGASISVQHSDRYRGTSWGTWNIFSSSSTTIPSPYFHQCHLYRDCTLVNFPVHRRKEKKKHLLRCYLPVPHLPTEQGNT